MTLLNIRHYVLNLGKYRDVKIGFRRITDVVPLSLFSRIDHLRVDQSEALGWGIGSASESTLPLPWSIAFCSVST